MNISKMREYAFMLLYELEIQKKFDEENLEIFLENNNIEDNNAKKYITKIVKGIKENEPKIEETISSKLKPEWKLDRISKINIALLKLSIYEIIYTDVPYKVAINEAIELAKKYSDDKVVKMINGVLDKIYHEREDNEQ